MIQWLVLMFVYFFIGGFLYKEEDTTLSVLLWPIVYTVELGMKFRSWITYIYKG